METNVIKSPVKIAFVVPKVYPLFNPAVEAIFGGAEVDVYFLATELAKDHGFKVSCVVADYGQPAVETREGVELVKSLDFGKNAIIGAKKIWKALRRVDADIYFMKTASAGVPLVAWFCRRHHKHFVYRLASQREANGLYLKDHPVLGRAFYRSLGRAAAVFAQNQEDGLCLKKQFGIDCEVIPNGHRLPVLESQDRQDILWVGRSHPVKRPEKFLSLARKFPGQSFVMICQCATGDMHYGDLVSEANKLANLRFIKRVAFHDVDGYFQRARVLVNTSDTEGFPNTFIQAARCGAAILTLNVNPDDFLNRHQCGLCAEGDWKRFCEMLGRLQDSVVTQTYGQNGCEYALRCHDIQLIAEKYKAVFRKQINH